MPEQRKPDYLRIAQLERELGIGQPEPEPQPVHCGPPICLIKGCDGETEEIRNWAGAVLRRIHLH